MGGHRDVCTLTLRMILAIFGILNALRAVNAEEIPANAGQQTWTFEADHVGEAPSGFSFGRTGEGRMGRWVVQSDEGAPSGRNVLAQVDTDQTDYRFPIAVADHPSLRDLRLSVRCKSVAGNIDQACGIVFRYQNDQNYYVTRANTLEGNVRLYRVVNGTRRQFAGWNGPVTSGSWHGLRVDAQGDHLEVSWDGQKVIDAHDQTFQNAGKIGVWTKSDSVTYFDDLRVERLEPGR